jgi:ferredoxin
MHDEPDLSGEVGERVREWDGCQLRGFAEVAGGHNFRAAVASRLRHRVFRKGKWIQEQTGLPGCVGCGRCSRACTAKISLVEIYHQLAEEN